MIEDSSLLEGSDKKINKSNLDKISKQIKQWEIVLYVGGCWLVSFSTLSEENRLQLLQFKVGGKHSPTVRAASGTLTHFLQLFAKDSPVSTHLFVQNLGIVLRGSQVPVPQHLGNRFDRCPVAQGDGGNKRVQGNVKREYLGDPANSRNFFRVRIRLLVAQHRQQLVAVLTGSTVVISVSSNPLHPLFWVFLPVNDYQHPSVGCLLQR